MESLIKTGTSGKRLQTAARRVLTLLLVFVVAATYVPLDRSFAADRIAKKKTGAAEAKRPAGTAKKQECSTVKEQAPATLKNRMGGTLKNRAGGAESSDENVIIPVDQDQTPAPGYVKLTFEKGDCEGLIGNAVFHVRKGVEVQPDPPTAIPHDGYEFYGWSRQVRGVYNEDTVIFAMNGPMNYYRRVLFFAGDPPNIYPVGVATMERNQWLRYVPRAPYKAGFKFIGWAKKKADGSYDKSKLYTKSALKSDYLVSESTDFLAIYDKKESGKVTVTFDNEGIVLGIAHIKKGDSLSAADIPQDPEHKHGSTMNFIGWKKKGIDGTYRKEALTSLKINADTVMEAVFMGGNYPAYELKPGDTVKEGFVKVTFDKGAHGEKLIGMTSFQLAKGVGIPLVDMMPGVVANKGWKFKGWNPELDPKERWYRFERDTVITATYESDNGGGAGYDPSEDPGESQVQPPKTDTQPEKPAIKEGPGEGKPEKGYIRIVFDPTPGGSLNGGQAGKKLSYDIKKTLKWGDVRDKITPVVSSQTEGYFFDGWSPGFPQDDEYVAGATYRATFSYNDRIKVVDPQNPGTPDPVPPARIYMDPGSDGHFEGHEPGVKLMFDVKRGTKWQNVGDELSRNTPAYKDNTKVFDGWKPQIPTNRETVEERTFKATYKEARKIKISYKVAGETVGSESVYVMDPPAKVPQDPKRTGTEFKGWRINGEGRHYSKAELEKCSMTTDTEFVADIEKLDNVIPAKPGTKKPQGYVEISFYIDGSKGRTDDVTKYYVNSEVEVTVPTPTVKSNKGWKHTGWDKNSTGRFTEGTIIAATYEKTNETPDDPGSDPSNPGDPGQPSDPSDPNKPNNPSDPSNPGKPGSDDGTEEADPQKPGIISHDPGETENPGEIPAGYARITFDPTADGSLNGGKLGGKLIFDIKKKLKWADVKNLILPKVKYKDGSQVFDKWDKDLPKDQDSISTDTYKAVFAGNAGNISIPENPNNPGTIPAGKVRITLDPTGDGYFGGAKETVGQPLVFDVDKTAKWGDVKNGIVYNKPAYKDRSKVFSMWNKAFPADGDTVGKETYVATYKQARKVTVTYKIGGAADVTEQVYLLDTPRKVPVDPKLAGYMFKGWQVDGRGKTYAKSTVEKFEIVVDMTLVARFEKDPNWKGDQNASKSGNAGVGDSGKGKGPLIIKSKKTIKLTPAQQAGMASDKYTYMQLTIKRVSIKMMPQQFKKLYKKSNLKTYFKLITKKKKKVVKSKAVRKKIYKKKIYMLKMVISGKQAKKYKVKAVDIGLPYAGKKIKKKTKFRIMRLYAKKIKKVKGRKGKRKKPLILRKKGKLLKAKYDKKTKAVYFRTKGNLSKMYIALVKIQPKKKAKKGKKANSNKVAVAGIGR